MSVDLAFDDGMEKGCKIGYEKARAEIEKGLSKLHKYVSEYYMGGSCSIEPFVDDSDHDKADVIVYLSDIEVMMKRLDGEK